MPIYETYVVWTEKDGHKSVGGAGPCYREAQADARAYAKDWADRVMKDSNIFESYEIVVRQVLEQ